jgi:hypothetical protein
MVELIVQGLEGAAQIGEVHYPAGFRAHRAAHVNLDTEGVSVHAGALVPLGHVRQAVRRFDLENAKYIHARIVPPTRGRRNRTQGMRRAATLSRPWS